MSKKKITAPEEKTEKDEIAETEEPTVSDDIPDTAPEAANDVETPETSEAETKKTNKFAAFFRNWGSALILLGALVFVCVLLGLAIGLGGDIYDKIAFVWVAAFVCEFVTYLKNKNTKTLIAMIITIVLAVCSAVAYGLELAEIIP